MNNKFIKNCIEKVSDEYLDNYKTDDKNNLFILFFNTIQKTKIHIWAHIVALFGWVFIPYSIPKYFGFLTIINMKQEIETIIITSLSLFIVCYIEGIFFPDFRIKWKFVYENKIYNILWNIGIILFVVLFLKVIGIKL